MGILSQSQGYLQPSQQRELKAQLEVLVIPEMETAIESGTLIENLNLPWSNATLEERHRIIVGMLDGVYIDMLSKKVVSIAPKPAFRKLFDIVKTKRDSGVEIINSKEKPALSAEADSNVGYGGDGGGLNSPSREGLPGYATSLSGFLF